MEMNKPKRGEKEGIAAALQFGAEFQANPGSSRSDYLNDSAWYFGKDSFRELSPEQKKICKEKFEEGIAREKKLQ